MHLRGIIDPAVQQAAQEYGAKNGILMQMREQKVDGVTVLPLEVLDVQEKTTWATRWAIKAACKDAGLPKRVIVRTSEQADWAGLVDVMPTIPEVKPSIWTLNSQIGRVRKGCYADDIMAYADKEGGGYDPDNVSISITPDIGRAGTRVIITEHPNLEDVVLVDFCEFYGGEVSSMKYSSLDFDHGQLQDTHHIRAITSTGLARFKPLAERALELSRRVRETGWFADDVALQLEGALLGDADDLLFQVRLLAERRMADFEIEGDHKFSSGERYKYRTFGVTAPEGKVWTVASGGIRSVFANFEEEHPEASYLLAPENITNPLTLKDFPTNMEAYMIKGYPKPALPHQNTRFVQMALRKGGVAMLEHLHMRPRGLSRGNKVRVISNGKELVIDDAV